MLPVAEPERPLRLSAHALFFHTSTATVAGVPGTPACRHHFLIVARNTQTPAGGAAAAPDGSSNSTIPVMICKHCFAHLRIEHAASAASASPSFWQSDDSRSSDAASIPTPADEDCPSATNPSHKDTTDPTAATPLKLCVAPRLHLYETRTTRDLEPPQTHITSICLNCTLEWRIHLLPAWSPHMSLANLFRHTDLTRQTTILFMLVFYIDNILEGSCKPINTQNPRFADLIGVNDASVAALGELGYRLDGTHFYPSMPDSDARDRLQMLAHELSLQKFLVQAGGGPTKNHLYTFAEATGIVCALFGVHDYQQHPQQQQHQHQQHAADHASAFLSEFWRSSLVQVQAYTVLGCTSGLTDTQISSVYSDLCRVDPTQRPVYLDAVVELATMRKSVVLADLVAMERSRGAVSASELRNAYQVLGIHPTQQAMDSKDIIHMFIAAFNAAPGRFSELRLALKVIQMYRECPILDRYLITGEVVQNTDCLMDMDVDPEGLPAGIENIGNTCYLNSLLQFYFSLPKLRDEVLKFEAPVSLQSSSLSTPPHASQQEHEQHQQDAPTVREKQAVDFVLRLKRLFTALVWTEKVSVTPEKALVETCLTGPLGTVRFGEQQDLHECMDKFLDMMMAAMGGRQSMSETQTTHTLFHDLFFGKTRQTLRYRDHHGTKHIRHKDESFHQLIVDPADDLYLALDAYFETQQVDLEGVSATRNLSVVSFPPILVIQINRVRFDRSIGRAYKSNNYMRYDKVLSLERYLAGCLESHLDRKADASKLLMAYSQLRRDLDAKVEPQQNSMSPLALIESSVRILKHHQQHRVGDPELGDKLSGVADQLRHCISDLQHNLSKLRAELADMYRDLNGEEYQLYAVFVHEGEASYGHYWLFLYDVGGTDDGVVKHDVDGDDVVVDGTNDTSETTNVNTNSMNDATPKTNTSDTNGNKRGRWIKYNDSFIKEVNESEVFADTTGSTANAYALVYVRSSDFAKLTQPSIRQRGSQKEKKKR